MPVKAQKLEVDLNAVVRTIIRKVMDERGLNESQLAEFSGIPQKTLNNVMRRGDFGLDRLTRICEYLEISPVAFFASHPQFNPEARQFLKFGKDALYDRFRTLLDADDSKRLVDMIELQKQYNVWDLCLRTNEDLLEIAKRTYRSGLREGSKDRSGAAERA